MGLTYPSEQFRGVMIQMIASIEIGGIAEAWGAPYVFIENGEAAVGTPLTSGSTVTAGTKIRITNNAEGQGGTSHKYFYTTDGTDPVPGNANTNIFNWNSNGPSTSANPSIIVPEGSGQFVVKAMTYGYGKKQSEIMTFIYNYPIPENSAFIAGPDELNIYATGEIEYTVSAANITDINTFKFALSYDTEKLEYKGIEPVLPADFGAWLLKSKHDAAAGEIEFTICGARGKTITSEVEAGIANITFTLIESLAEDDVIETELLSVYMVNPISGSSHNALITGATVSTIIIVDEVDPLLKYDINEDGVFDLIDLAIIIYRYFMVMEGEVLWAGASTYDHMNIGVIDTRNIIALYSLFENQ